MKIPLVSGVLTMHGVFIASALIVTVFISFIFYKKRNNDETLLLHIAPLAILFGFAGARFMYVTVCDSLYIEEAEKWRLLDGGYALFGAFYAVALTVVIFCFAVKKRDKISGVFDALSFAAPLAIAVGRMGSVFTEDCLGETVEIENLRFFPIALYSDTYGEYQYAVFFYEAVYCILSFVFIAYVCKKNERKGAATYLFTVLYCGGRSFFESLRSDSIYVAFVRISQVMAVLTLIGAFIVMCVKLAKKTGFKKRYLILYAVFASAFAAAFASEFFMGSESRFGNTFIVMICCIIMIFTALYAGNEYLYALKSTKRKRIKPALKRSR